MEQKNLQHKNLQPKNFQINIKNHPVTNSVVIRWS